MVKKKLILLISAFILINLIYVGSAYAVSQNNTTTYVAGSSPEGYQPVDNNTTVAVTNTSVSYQTAKFPRIRGYFINPSKTPINTINPTQMKNQGITDIYVLTSGTTYKNRLTSFLTKFQGTGIRINAWVFPPFSYAKEVAAMGCGLLADVETYNMTPYLSQIKSWRNDTKGHVLAICVKADRWDGYQYYDQIAPLCDYIVPMTYLGDYGKSLSSLQSWVQSYSAKYPGKIVPALETYVRDGDYAPKTAINLLSEVDTVAPYVPGVILFRYGLVASDFLASNLTANNVLTMIKVTFNNTIKTGNNNIQLKTSDGTTIPVLTSINGSELTISPGIFLTNGIKYILSLNPGCVTDLAGNPNALFALNFTADNIPPKVTAIDPAKNAANVPANKVIKVSFSEPIKAGSMWIEVKNISGVMVKITKSINGNVLWINHTSPLTSGKYTLILHTGSITDLAGNPLAYFTSSFTVDTIPPKVTSTSPLDGATGVSLISPLTIKFSEDVVAGINYSKIYIKNLTTGKIVTITKSISGNTLIIKQTLSRLSRNTYQVYIPAGAVKDKAGNSLASTYTFNFKTR